MKKIIRMITVLALTITMIFISMAGALTATSQLDNAGITMVAYSASSISKSKAISIAKKHAKSKWNARNITDVEAEKDSYRYNGKKVAVWEVEFDAKSGGKWYEYEYKIRRSDGKILRYSRERD